MHARLPDPYDISSLSSQLLREQWSMILVHDLGGRVLHLEAPALGYAGETLQRRHLRELMPHFTDETFARMVTVLQHVDRAVSVHGIFRAADGSDHAMDLRASRLPDGNICVLANPHVVSPLAGLQDLRAAIAASELPVIAYDFSGAVFDANAAFSKLIGMNHDMLLRSNIATVHAEQDDAHQFMMARIADPWPGPLDSRLQHADGKTVNVRARRHLVYRDGRYLVVEELEDRNETTRLNAALEATQSRLNQALKLETLGRLVGGVAHDFNNLLTVIMGAANNQQRLLEHGEAAHGLAEDIHQAALGGAALTRQLLAFYRDQAPKPQVLEPGEVISHLDRMIRRMIGPDIVLETVIAPQTGRIRCDRTELEQAILNMAINARDAMPEGGTLSLRGSRLVVAEKGAEFNDQLQAGAYVLLEIADTGKGMPEDVRARVFEPFLTTRSDTGGSGIGLATVEAMVHKAGGAISCISAPDKGTTFRVLLPEVEREQRGTGTGIIRRRRDTASRSTLLLVEDDAGIRNLVDECLQDEGYLVHIAADADEAIGLAEHVNYHIDLLITDIALPRMRGDELAEHLRHHRSDLRVLFITGYQQLWRQDSSSDHKLEDWLHKPFALDELLHKVASMLEA